MTPLRIGFDLDGTLADLASAYAAVEERLYGEKAGGVEPAPEVREAEQHAAEEQEAAETVPAHARPSRRGPSRRGGGRRESVWGAIERTPNFWTTLQPIDPAAIRRLNDLAREQHWEVFFVTQRPATDGDTVQRQTQTWLVEQGFLLPSVIPLSGGRGRAAAALHLDFLVDDTPHNCVDVLSESSARAILLVEPGDENADKSARRLGIGVAHSIGEALDLLVQATAARANPSLFEKLRTIVGWK